MRDIEVIVEGEHIECKEGTELLELAQRYQRKYQDDIVLAMVNHKLSELWKPAQDGDKITFLTTGTVDRKSVV